MRKRALQATAMFCIIIASAALWARQNAAGANASTAEIDSRVEHFLRDYYAWGSAFEVKAGALQPSPIPGLNQVPVTVTYQGQTDHALVYVTEDGHYIVRGAIDSLLGNPYSANIQKLDLQNHPFVGPAKACVNVVDFSDFECPHCLAAYQALQQLVPRYPQVRFTFMDFPLTAIHPWAMTAALTARCAYEQKPSAYPQLQKLIFDNQDQITQDNAATKFAAFATQAGLNAAALQACVASSNTKNSINADLALGAQLNVTETPTIFVNGRPLMGEDSQLLERYISYELAQCQPAH